MASEVADTASRAKALISDRSDRRWEQLELAGQNGVADEEGRQIFVSLVRRRTALINRVFQDVASY